MEKVIAPCGLDCFNCTIFSENVTPETQKMVGDSLSVPPETVVCNGCNGHDAPEMMKLMNTECSTLNCVKEKGNRFCFECNDFPCEYLMPTADGADIYPHNFKLYNLCTMKKIGIEKWCEQAADIRRKYYTTKFVSGEGGAASE